MMEWIRFLLAALLLLGGMAVSLIAMYGVHKFKFALNRMHAAALCDTLAISLVMLGLVVICGFSWQSCKLLLIVFFLWIASPVSSHLLAFLEVTISKRISEELTPYAAENVDTQTDRGAAEATRSTLADAREEVLSADNEGDRS